MGAATLMVGATGNDEPGERMRAVLQGSGIDTALIKVDKAHPTGQAFINVSAAGENSIVVVTGANGALRSADVPIRELSHYDVFLAQLEIPVATVRTFFQHAATQRGLTLLNAAPAEQDGATLFPLVDILIVNEAELATYAGLPALRMETESIAAAARRLICRDGQTIVVTLGANGVVVVSAEQQQLIPSRPANVVDTTGAGDCFCGTLAAGLAQDMTLTKAVALAVTAASISVERPGAASSIPSRAEVDALLSPAPT